MIRVGIILVLISTLLGAFGQYFFKLGAESAKSSNILDLMLNKSTIIGVVLYGVATVLYVAALKNEDLTTLAPLIALSYLWATILGVVLLNEVVSLWKWIGILLIVLGALIIIRG